MSKSIYRLKLKLYSLLGTEKRASFTYFVISAVAYILLIVVRYNPSVESLDSIFTSEIASITGILIGFISTTLGIITTTNNEVVKRLYISGNINVVLKIFFNSIVSFVISLLLYFYKLFITIDCNLDQIKGINKIAAGLVLHIGLFSFVYGFVLFLVSVYFFKRILMVKKEVD